MDFLLIQLGISMQIARRYNIIECDVIYFLIFDIIIIGVVDGQAIQVKKSQG